MCIFKAVKPFRWLFKYKKPGSSFHFKIFFNLSAHAKAHAFVFLDLKIMLDPR